MREEQLMLIFNQLVRNKKKLFMLFAIADICGLIVTLITKTPMLFLLYCAVICLILKLEAGKIEKKKDKVIKLLIQLTK